MNEEQEQDEESDEQPQCPAYIGGDDYPWHSMIWRQDGGGDWHGKCSRCGLEVSE